MIRNLHNIVGDLEGLGYGREPREKSAGSLLKTNNKLDLEERNDLL